MGSRFTAKNDGRTMSVAERGKEFDEEEAIFFGENFFFFPAADEIIQRRYLTVECEFQICQVIVIFILWVPVLTAIALNYPIAEFFYIIRLTLYFQIFIQHIPQFGNMHSIPINI